MTAASTRHRVPTQDGLRQYRVAAPHAADDSETMAAPTHPRRLLVGIAVVAALGACASAPPPEPPADVAYHDSATGPRDEQPAAELAGILVRDDGCTYVDQGDGNRVVPVFPDLGIRWEGRSLVVGRHTYPLGDEVSFGGGGTLDVGTVPSACDSDAAHFAVYDPS